MPPTREQVIAAFSRTSAHAIFQLAHIAFDDAYGVIATAQVGAALVRAAEEMGYPRRKRDDLIDSAPSLVQETEGKMWP